MEFKIIDGSVREPIVNAHGITIGEVIYNPHDIGILDRYKQKLPEIEKMQTTFSELKETDSGDILRIVRSHLEPLFDYIFYPGFYSGAFSRIYPLTILENGESFCIVLMREILQRVQSTVGTDLKESETRKKKYLQGYNE